MTRAAARACLGTAVLRLDRIESVAKSSRQDAHALLLLTLCTVLRPLVEAVDLLVNEDPAK